MISSDLNFILRAVTSYANDFTFLTVKGSGHMVPQFRPVQAFAMFERMIKHLPFDNDPTDAKVELSRDGRGLYKLRGSQIKARACCYGMLLSTVCSEFELTQREVAAALSR